MHYTQNEVHSVCSCFPQPQSEYWYLLLNNWSTCIYVSCLTETMGEKCDIFNVDLFVPRTFNGFCISFYECSVIQFTLIQLEISNMNVGCESSFWVKRTLFVRLREFLHFKVGFWTYQCEIFVDGVVSSFTSDCIIQLALRLLDGGLILLLK